MVVELNVGFDTNGDLFIVDGKPVGFGIVDRRTKDFTIRTFELNSTEYGDNRGKGYGRALYVIIEDEAKKNGCEKVIATDCNVDTIGFWKKMGLVQTGKTADGYPIMEKSLK